MVKDGIWDVFIGEFALSGGYQLDIQNVEHVSVNYFADFGPSIEMR